ncbi:MAG: LysR family transcriptional regulator [Bacteroidia bacterium]
MTLQQLHYVLALDTHKQFVKAADSCHVTQPTLTLQLKKLEDEISAILFDRSATPLKATPIGEQFIAQAKRILWDVDELKNLVNNDKEMIDGSFKIGIIPTLAPNLLALFLSDFISANPKTNLIIEELQSEAIIEMLKNRQLDVGILSAPLNEHKLREEHLFDEPFLVFTDEQNDLLSYKSINAKNLKSDGLWVLKDGHCFRNQTLNICNFKPSQQHKNVTMEGASIDTLKKLIRQIKGYTLIPELSYDEKNDVENVLGFDHPKPVRSICMGVHKHFTREKLISELKRSIIANIPNSFAKNTRVRRVKWR